ncbi:hypothetical protein TNCV_1511041 [Trichonephila clavipes]|nr:hypothetical protein TNCV_1511041 [Trichonephila clavipes]
MSVVSQINPTISILLFYPRPRLRVGLSPKVRPKTIQRLRFQNTGLPPSLTALSGVKQPSFPKHINPTEVAPIRANIPYPLANSSLRHYIRYFIEKLDVS